MVGRYSIIERIAGLVYNFYELESCCPATLGAVDDVWRLKVKLKQTRIFCLLHGLFHFLIGSDCGKITCTV